LVVLLVFFSILIPSNAAPQALFAVANGGSNASFVSIDPQTHAVTVIKHLGRSPLFTNSQAAALDPKSKRYYVSWTNVSTAGTGRFVSAWNLDGVLLLEVKTPSYFWAISLAAHTNAVMYGVADDVVGHGSLMVSKIDLPTKAVTYLGSYPYGGFGPGTMTYDKSKQIYYAVIHMPPGATLYGISTVSAQRVVETLLPAKLTVYSLLYDDSTASVLAVVRVYEGEEVTVQKRTCNESVANDNPFLLARITPSPFSYQVIGTFPAAGAYWNTFSLCTASPYLYTIWIQCDVFQAVVMNKESGSVVEQWSMGPYQIVALECAG